MSLLLAAALVIALAAVVLMRWGPLPNGVPAGPNGTQQVAVSSKHHVPLDPPVDYSAEPPAGGDHYKVWQNCGTYDEPLIDEYVVHSMEHGAVWVTYRPDLPANEIEQLRDVVREGYLGDERYIVLSPYEGLGDDIVASAWGRQLRLDDVDDARLLEFLQLFAGGPQSPEQLYPCGGGEGTPLG